MPQEVDPLTAYLEHLKVRVQAERGGRNAPVRPALPESMTDLCSREPRECLNLILRALETPLTPEAVRAIGNELLENLLNENAAAIADDVSERLRSSKRFRQAFAFGNYSSVDPALIDDWVKVFQDLSTTKDAERKSLWRGER